MPDRSVSLPLCGGGKSTATGWKEKGLIHTKEKEREIEENFCVSALCFKTDLMTVRQRREIMERQKVMAELNYNKEISYFSSLMSDLRYAWQDKEVSEILSRLACQVLGLGDKGRILAKEADSLGSLRQELSYLKTVSVMVEYVELLAERNSDVHDQLVNARKVLGDNNIAIEKPVKADPEATAKTRSVSLVSSTPTARRVNYHKEERSKSVTEREILENNNEGRKKSKKCSLFATINEIGDKPYDTPAPIRDGASQDLWRKRRKSSKKVSIAENLNCDYSDTNISDNESDLHNIMDASDAIKHEFKGCDECDSHMERVPEMLQVTLNFCYIVGHHIILLISVIIFFFLILSQYYF